jgi:hypothetical protein
MPLVSPLSKLALQPGNNGLQQSGGSGNPVAGGTQGPTSLADWMIVLGPLLGGVATGGALSGLADTSDDTSGILDTSGDIADSSEDTAGLDDTANAPLPSTNIGTGDVPLSSAAPTGNMAASSGSSGLSNLQQLAKLANNPTSPTSSSTQSTAPSIGMPAMVPLPNIGSSSNSAPNTLVPQMPSLAVPNLASLNQQVQQPQAPAMPQSVLPAQNPLLMLAQQMQNQQANPNSPNTPLQSTNIPQGVGQLPQGVNTGNLAALSGAQDATGTSSASGFDTPMLRQLQNYVTNVPQYSDYAPSRTGRIMASLAGMGGSVSPQSMWGGVPVGFKADTGKQFEITKAIENAPYERALQNYQIGGQALEKGAGIEERDIQNKREIEYQREQNRIRQESVDTAAKKESDWADLTKQLRDTQQQNANTRSSQVAINDFKARNPNSKIEVAGNKLVAINPQTGETTILKGEDGQPLDSGKLDDTTKMHIQLQNQLAEINARVAGTGANQKALETQKEGNRQTDIAARGEQQRTTNTTKPVNPRANAVPTTSTTVKTTPAKPNMFGSTNPLFGGKPETSTTAVTTKGPSQYQNPNPASPAQNLTQAPPLDKRVIGVTKFQLPNGKIGTWNGVGWVAP